MKPALKLIRDEVALMSPQTRIVRLCGWSEQAGGRRPLVSWPDESGGPRVARVVAGVDGAALSHGVAAGAEVLVTCTRDGTLVITALMAPEEGSEGAHVEVNGNVISLTAEKELVLRCGEVTLRRKPVTPSLIALKCAASKLHRGCSVRQARGAHQPAHANYAPPGTGGPHPPERA